MINIVVNLLGVATLGLPFAMAEAGPIFGCLGMALTVKSSYQTWKVRDLEYSLYTRYVYVVVNMSSSAFVVTLIRY